VRRRLQLTTAAVETNDQRDATPERQRETNASYCTTSVPVDETIAVKICAIGHERRRTVNYSSYVCYCGVPAEELDAGERVVFHRLRMPREPPGRLFETAAGTNTRAKPAKSSPLESQGGCRGAR